LSESDDDDARHRANITVLIAAAIIVIIGLITFHYFSRNLALERCQEERRSDCDSVTGSL
jgi:hypothetical protein